MIRAFVALGSNLGNPVQTIEDAVDAMAALRGSLLAAISSLYRTAPVGLLDELFALEARFGRQRTVRNAPRTLDLDLLLHGDTVQDDPDVTLPHPRMRERAFVLAPLAEIAPELVIPGRGPVTELLAACADQRVHALARQQ